MKPAGLKYEFCEYVEDDAACTHSVGVPLETVYADYKVFIDGLKTRAYENVNKVKSRDFYQNISAIIAFDNSTAITAEFAKIMNRLELETAVTIKYRYTSVYTTARTSDEARLHDHHYISAIGDGDLDKSNLRSLVNRLSPVDIVYAEGPIAQSLLFAMKMSMKYFIVRVTNKIDLNNLDTLDEVSRDIFNHARGHANCTIMGDYICGLNYKPIGKVLYNNLISKLE